MELGGDKWEVALVELGCPKSWNNFTQEWSEIIFLKCIGGIVYWYNKSSKLMNEINKLKPSSLQSVFRYDAIARKVLFSIGQEEGVFYHQNLNVF